MFLCLLLCALPLVLPAAAHVAAIVLLSFGMDSADPLTFAPYVAPAAVATYYAPERPSIRMPSPPCLVAVARVEPRAYPIPVFRAPRSASGRFGRVGYSGSNESYNLSLTVSG